MPKAPPRLKPPASVPAPRQVYAHIHGGFEVACPRCLYLVQVGAIKRRQYGHRPEEYRGGTGYDRTRGTLRCPGCHTVYYVGIILWPMGRKGALPEDHVPSVHELGQLRGVGAGGEAPRGKSGRRIVNAIGEVEGDEG